MTFASRQTSRSTAVPSAAGLADDRQRVDLDEVGVVGLHRRHEALGDRDGGLEVPAQAHREGQLARLEVLQPEERVGVAADDRVRVRLGDLLDLDAALGRAHQQDPAFRPVEDRGEVELLDDVRGRPDEDLAHGHALDVHAEDRLGDLLRLVRRAGELHAAGLAAAADQDLGLDHDLVGAGGEEPFRRGPCLGRGVGDLPGRHRQALGDEQRLGVGFLEFHARQAPWRGGAGDRDGTASAPPRPPRRRRPNLERNGDVASPY